MKLRYLMLALTCSLWLLAPVTKSEASPINPKLPSTLNFQSLNGIAVPSTESEWAFEMSRLDMAIGSSHMSGLRARNSDIYLLQYMLLHTVLVTDTNEQNQLASFAAANGYDVESAFLHFYDDTTVSYAAGGTETIPGYGGGSATSLKQARVKNRIWSSERYIYNLKSPLFRKFKGDYYRKVMTSGLKPDGIFIDETSPIESYIPNASSGGHIIEYGNKTRSQSASEFMTDMTAAFAEVNRIMGSDSYTGDRVILPNIAEYVQAFMDLGLNGADGLLTEFWIQAVQPRIPYAYEAAKQLADKGKILIFSQGVAGPEVSHPGNYSSAMDRHQMFALTNYWIAKQGNYTYYQQMTRSEMLLLQEFWCKAREFDVGAPIDPLYSTWQTGTDSVGQNFTIYKRNYTKALMLSRPQVGWPASPNYSTSSQLYTLPGTFKLLHYDGTLGPEITKIGLCMGEAVTLVKSDGTTPPPTDTTPPVISGATAGSVTASSATITWSTNEAATGRVEYGKTTSYGSSVAASALAISQSVNISGLSASTLYHYRVVATDEAGNTATSADYSFTTTSTAPAGTPAPFIRQWAILGSFAFVSSGEGHTTDYVGGEAAISPSPGDVTTGKTWTDFTSTTDYVNFLPLFSPNTFAVAYANVYVNSPTDKSCQLRIGSDDGVKVYLNGTVVVDEPLERSPVADDDIVNVNLKAGWNQLLCKIENYTAAWQLFARFCDADGNEVPGLTYQVNDPTQEVGSPQIAVSISVDKTTVKPGEAITYTVTYKNTGNGPAASVVVSADVDPNVNFVSASNGGTYDAAARVVRWGVGTLQAGASASVTYNVTVK